MSDRYAVMGNPISHSKSPQIHAAFARQCGQEMRYEALRVEPGQFPQAVAAFFEAGGCGLNVTVPFKQEAWALAARLSERARLAGAVNTLYRDREGLLCGDNTDGLGMVTDIVVNRGGEIRNKRVLTLGAGGAVRGVLEPLLQQSPTELVIANRSPEKASSLSRDFGHLGTLQGVGLEAIEGPFDLVINGTSASLQGELPPLPSGVLAPGGWCYDMMYGAKPTVFMEWALKAGAAEAIDGLGMLVEQAAESFRLWRGVQPETGAVIAELRRQLNS